MLHRTVDTASLEFEAAPEAVNSVPLKLRLVDEPKQHSKGIRVYVYTYACGNGLSVERVERERYFFVLLYAVRMSIIIMVLTLFRPIILFLYSHCELLIVRSVLS